MWYLAIVMLISLAFSVTLYSVATGELNRGLQRQTQRIDSQFPVFQNDPMLAQDSDYASGAHRILLRLVGFNIIVLIGAGFASYWLARRTLEPIEAAHEQQKRFTADVSHELRTPLTALRMESEVALLHTESSKAELRQTLTSNLEEVTKIEVLINNLLRLSRLESDELQQGFSPLDNQQLAKEAIAQTQKVAELRGVRVEQKLQAGSIMGDKNSIVQLLVILLDNAIKYSPAGKSVTLSSKQKGDSVFFTIQDEGMGIEPAALNHVFDRFYRADNSRAKNDSEGFGLGLSIAKMIADLHQGTITLQSWPGQGTTATVTLASAATTKSSKQ